MDKAKAVTADFIRNQTHVFTLTVVTTGDGLVTSSPTGVHCSNTCASLFSANAVVTLTASASAGFAFTGWSGACTGIGPCVVTLNQAIQVNAAFRPMSIELTLDPPTPQAGESVDPHGVNHLDRWRFCQGSGALHHHRTGYIHEPRSRVRAKRRSTAPATRRLCCRTGCHLVRMYSRTGPLPKRRQCRHALVPCSGGHQDAVTNITCSSCHGFVVSAIQIRDRFAFVSKAWPFCDLEAAGSSR